MNSDTSIIEMLNEEPLREFLAYKRAKSHLDKNEEKLIQEYTDRGTFIKMKQDIDAGMFPAEYAVKKIISKEGTEKKRTVYSYGNDVSITLKFIAYQLYQFDELFCDNCYAFRKNYGAGNAIRRIIRDKSLGKKYCLKVDIQNYFNSIDVDKLLDKLEVIKNRDEALYKMFEKILSEDRVIRRGEIVKEKHGAMAGIPIAPFLANVYLMDVDWYFWDRGIDYYRYSDDILIFAENYDRLTMIQGILYEMLDRLGLHINHDKEKISVPGDSWEFLGFAYKNGEIDLANHTKRKMKAKIKRKANALRSWQRKKGLESDKAAIGFIRAMNRKFYGNEPSDKDCEENHEKNHEDFTWSRWFFPNITVTDGLKELDSYMQEYIRYTITGRHYKGNYRITYEQMKAWGYRNLVHEYYERRQK